LGVLALCEAAKKCSSLRVSAHPWHDVCVCARARVFNYVLLCVYVGLSVRYAKTLLAMEVNNRQALGLLDEIDSKLSQGACELQGRGMLCGAVLPCPAWPKRVPSLLPCAIISSFAHVHPSILFFIKMPCAGPLSLGDWPQL